MADKTFLIQLTNSLYKTTLLFPKKEPLRYKMRELADEILADPSEKKLEILDSFFEVAKVQNWVRVNDLLAIQKEYDRLKSSLKEGESEAVFTDNKLEEGKFVFDEVRSACGEVKEEVLAVNNDGHKRSNGLAERQEMIINFLKTQGRAQVWQISQIFPQVSKRTIRRDVEYMFAQGIIDRIGEKNDTFYQLRREL